MRSIKERNRLQEGKRETGGIREKLGELKRKGKVF